MASSHARTSEFHRRKRPGEVEQGGRELMLRVEGNGFSTRLLIVAGSEDPVGQRLEGVRVLMERYRTAGLDDISHDFYTGGRHEMLSEIDRDEVRAHLLGWIRKLNTLSRAKVSAAPLYPGS